MKAVFSNIILLLFTCTSIFGATYTVTNNNNSGAGSLRQAITDANASAGTDNISFNIAGSSVAARTIYPLTTLPAITGTVVLDGTTQSSGSAFGSSNAKILVWDTTTAGLGYGIDVRASKCEIYGLYIKGFDLGVAVNAAFTTNDSVKIGAANKGNVISGNDNEGIHFNGTYNSSIKGNFIGVDTTGLVAEGNGEVGVYFQQTELDYLGGSAAGERNIISGNVGSGVLIWVCDSLYIKNNYIGLGRDGTTSLGNGLGGTPLAQEYSGIQGSNSTYIFVGGGNAGEGNVVGGNRNIGISLIQCTYLTFKGNYVGVDASGTLSRPNTLSIGINCSQSTRLTIGGSGANDGNIISNNGNDGIYLWGSDTTTIIGNKIGVDITGTIDFGNGDDGIWSVFSDHVEVRNNIISGNAVNGINATWGSEWEIMGNYIGTNSSGSARIANAANGIYVNSNFNRMYIGSTTASDRNIISGNGDDGIDIDGGDSAIIYNNYVGINAAGTDTIGNKNNGIYIRSGALYAEVGGNGSSYRNIASGNGAGGLRILENNTVVQGNYIGTNAVGTGSKGNIGDGIYLNASTTIGGTASGQRNVITSNGGKGIYVSDGTNYIYNNYIGIGADGSTALGNVSDGVYTNDPTYIGGATAGQGNVISNNGGNGIYLLGAGATGSEIKGNYIGLRANGSTAAGNTSNGIQAGGGISSTAIAIIGGSTSNERNIISSNGGHGIYLYNFDASTVQGNYIGTDVSGTLSRGNTGSGIYADGSSNLIIGGSSSALGNVIANNSGSGIYLTGNSSTSKIKGNYIGMAANGTTAMGNTVYGIYLSTASDYVTIGGTSSGSENIISNSGSDGIYSADSDFDTIQGNYIGTDISGTLDNGNMGRGIYLYRTDVFGGSDNNTIGGSASGAGNIIAYNGNVAVDVYHSESDNNLISRNSMFCNSQSVGTDGGISLSSTGNNGIAAPTITTATTSNLSGTIASCIGCTIELFAQDANCSNCEGMSYVGSATTDGAGNWSFTGASGTFMLAYTVSITDGSRNTSPFSSCTVILPVELIGFRGQTQGDEIKLNWSTASEVNSDYFTIEKSTDGISFSTIGTLDAKGWSNALSEYAYVDENPENGINYYRLSQTDIDGSQRVYNSIAISYLSEVLRFSRTGNDVILISENENGLSGNNYTLQLFNQQGQLVNTIKSSHLNNYAFNIRELNGGAYYLNIYSENTSYQYTFSKTLN